MNTENLFKNTDRSRTAQIIISLILILVVFGAGFYVGRSKQPAVPVGINNAAGSSGADMAPFWKVWGILDDKFSPASSTAPAVTAQDKIWGAIQGLAASYGDPYTTFFPPVESQMFNEEISGSFDGVGMEIDLIDGVLTVVSPLKNSPAFNAGVKPGDKILKIGDKLTTNMSTDEAVKLIRGENGTTINITFTRDGVKDPFVKVLTRQAIEIPTVETKKLDSGVFVINLYNFSAVSPNDFRTALREFVQSGDDKLILDLRNNPGGYLEAALDMASWFLPAGKTVVTENFGGKQDPNVYKSKGYDIFNNNLKMAILVNRGSASASEILAGALQEQGKAVLVGENTFGKGSVQELVPVTDNTSLKVTVAHWFTPNGRSISNGGLTPDIKVETTAENTKNGADPVLDAAVKYLTK